MTICLCATVNPQNDHHISLLSNISPDSSCKIEVRSARGFWRLTLLSGLAYGKSYHRTRGSKCPTLKPKRAVQCTETQAPHAGRESGSASSPDPGSRWIGWIPRTNIQQRCSRREWLHSTGLAQSRPRCLFKKQQQQKALRTMLVSSCLIEEFIIGHK